MLMFDCWWRRPQRQCSELLRCLVGGPGYIRRAARPTRRRPKITGLAAPLVVAVGRVS